MAVSKVIYGETTLMDLTSDTVTASTLAEGITAHDATGASITGTFVDKDTTYTLSSSDYKVVLTGSDGSTTTSSSYDYVGQREASNTLNREYPILLKSTQGSTSNTGYAYFRSGVTLNPSTETITASGFIGDLEGNASTATKLNNALTINGTTYDGSSPVDLTIDGGSTPTSISSAEIDELFTE